MGFYNPESGWVSDQRFFDELRGHMQFAFGCKPALASIYLDNKATKQSMCNHLYQNGENGPACTKCGDLRWGPDGDQP